MRHIQERREFRLYDGETGEFVKTLFLTQDELKDLEAFNSNEYLAMAKRNSGYGNYINISTEWLDTLQDTSPRLIADFIRLACCVNKDNVVMNDKVEADETTVRKMISDAHGSRLSSMEALGLISRGISRGFGSNNITLNPNVIASGRSIGSRLGDTKVYKDFYSKAYDDFDTGQRTGLGSLYKLASHLSYEFGVVCENVMQTDYELAKPVSAGRTCELIGKASAMTHSSRYLQTFESMSFVAKCNKWRIMLVSKGERKGIYINPLLMCRGQNLSKLLETQITNKKGEEYGYRYTAADRI